MLQEDENAIFLSTYFDLVSKCKHSPAAERQLIDLTESFNQKVMRHEKLRLVRDLNAALGKSVPPNSPSAFTTSPSGKEYRR